MGTFFYIDPTGTRYGPVTVAQLSQWLTEGRIGPDSTLQDSAGRIIRVRDVLNIPAAPMAPTYYEAPRPVYGYPRTAPVGYVPNHLAKAIISTVCFGILPVGVVAIVYAAQVDGFLKSGQMERAMDSSRKANVWANWSIGIAAVLSVVQILALLGMLSTVSRLR